MDIIQNNNLRRSVLRMEEKRNILKNFVDKMEKLFGKSLKKLILYGSYARGDYKENSDIDIMILVKMSDEEIRLVKNDIYDLAFEFEINTGIEFSPIIKNEDQYEYWIDTLPFYRNVRDEGVVIDE
mgnify:CR=1 FL=1